MRLNLVCALAQEAKPLINQLRLQRDPASRKLPVFGCPKQNIWLVVAGMGPQNAAAACAYLGLWQNPNPGRQAFLNTGVAGSGSYKEGTVLLAHKCTAAYDRHTVYFPSPTWFSKFGLPTASVTTHQNPCRTYPAEGCVDMEASGFFAGALLHSDRDWIHCLKVVSDGPQTPPGSVTLAAITNYMTAALPRITTVIKVLKQEAGKLPTENVWPLPAARLSFYQQQVWQELARRLSIWEGPAAVSRWASGARDSDQGQPPDHSQDKKTKGRTQDKAAGARWLKALADHLEQREYSWPR